MNHSTNFLKPGTKDVHTNRIEGEYYSYSRVLSRLLSIGQWHIVKRTLPECGNYRLESYLPVFLWRKMCDQTGKDPFWELIRLLKKHQDVFCASGEASDSITYFLNYFIF